MSRKDYQVWAEILAQIIWAEEDLGRGVRENKGAINYKLKQNNERYNNDKFWEAVEKEVLTLKGLFRE